MEEVSFHRRILPDTSIALSSAEGRVRLQESMASQYAEPFIELSQVWSTQSEPAFCGLATLTTILNACLIDPGVRWKGVWRWYVDEMLDCCRPLESIRQDGITMDEFGCLARCNGLNLTIHRASSNTIEDFERMVKLLCKWAPLQHGTVRGEYMAVSYSRKELLQTGDGHFSPIGAYHESTRSLLIMDVARFKYPPHWVALDDLFQAMCRIDTVTNQSRGWFVLSRPAQLTKRPLMGSWMCDNIGAEDINSTLTRSGCKLPFDKNSWSLFIKRFVQGVNNLHCPTCADDAVKTLLQTLVRLVPRDNRIRLARESICTKDDKRREIIIHEAKTLDLFGKLKSIMSEENNVDADDLDISMMAILLLSLVAHFMKEAGNNGGKCCAKEQCLVTLSREWMQWISREPMLTLETSGIHAELSLEIGYATNQMTALTQCCTDEHHRGVELTGLDGLIDTSLRG